MNYIPFGHNLNVSWEFLVSCHSMELYGFIHTIFLFQLRSRKVNHLFYNDEIEKFASSRMEGRPKSMMM